MEEAARTWALELTRAGNDLFEAAHRVEAAFIDGSEKSVGIGYVQQKLQRDMVVREVLSSKNPPATMRNSDFEVLWYCGLLWSEPKMTSVHEIGFLY